MQLGPETSRMSPHRLPGLIRVDNDYLQRRLLSEKASAEAAPSLIWCVWTSRYRLDDLTSMHALHLLLCLTSKMSHAHGRRGSCRARLTNPRLHSIGRRLAG